ncbi:MAG: sulfotransferase domain-containing protein, partial [Bacteroidota bacterium]
MTSMEKDRIPIYIVGYPKSGNTWLTRLVGDTLNSPTGSAYGKHQADLATEGWNRPGKYIVLKSHHSQKDKPEFITTQSKIIYIYRDFRDVLISGFFHHYRIDESYILQTDPTNNRSFYQKMWQILFRVEMANLTRGWGSFSSGNQLSKVCVNFLKGRWFF